jgi:CYTH domain-containing protein
MHEIERKFILNELPELDMESFSTYERHFIYAKDGVEFRIQRKGEAYECERKGNSSGYSIEKVKFAITLEEFELLKTIAFDSLMREAYTVIGSPGISVKVYKGRFAGLIRAEVEFSSVDEAEAFQVPEWFGKEITFTPLGMDARLIMLSEEEFRRLLAEYRT